MTALRTPRRAKAIALLLLVGGGALFAALLVDAGLGEVADALRSAGWGLLAVAAFHLVPMAADTASWACLFERRHRPRFGRLLAVRWIGESVNSLLPAAQVGGDVVRARLVALAGVPGPAAAATVVVDLTLGILSQAAFTLMGAALLLWLLDGSAGGVAGPLLGAVGAGALIFAGLYAVQRAGLVAALARFAMRLVPDGTWSQFVDRAEAFDQGLETIYRRRRAVAAGFSWTLAAWIVGAGEVWLAFQVIGVPVSFAEALVLESVAQAVRAAFFLVPGALGLQEGGVIVAAGLLGIPVEAALAMALAKRVRELCWGIPGLFAWPFVEGRRLWRRRFRLPGRPGDC